MYMHYYNYSSSPSKKLMFMISKFYPSPPPSLNYRAVCYLYNHVSLVGIYRYRVIAIVVCTCTHCYCHLLWS